jgi:hypothetical protein
VLTALGAVAIVLGFALTSPVPQDPAYHLFADGRSLFGIANSLNVLSNLPFLLVGSWGLVYVLRNKPCAGELAAAYAVFFLGIFLTGFGSGYYHLAPANGTLVWDRLPMTIGFAGLFSVVIGEFVSTRRGRQLLLPLLAVGAGSVVYWASTEARGAGDLRPYAVVQFLPMLLTVVILAAYGKDKPATRYFWVVILFYVLAKVAEFYDVAIFSALGAISGHSLKHLLASLSPVAILFALAARRASVTRDTALGRAPH